MKKFNLEEFLWFILLIIMAICSIYLICTKKINLYIEAQMIKYIYLSITMLTLMAFFQLKNVFTSKGNSNIKIKLIPIILAILIGIISI